MDTPPVQHHFAFLQLALLVHMAEVEAVEAAIAEAHSHWSHLHLQYSTKVYRHIRTCNTIGNLWKLFNSNFRAKLKHPFEEFNVMSITSQ